MHLLLFILSIQPKTCCSPFDVEDLVAWIIPHICCSLDDDDDVSMSDLKLKDVLITRLKGGGGCFFLVTAGNF